MFVKSARVDESGIFVRIGNMTRVSSSPASNGRARASSGSSGSIKTYRNALAYLDTLTNHELSSRSAYNQQSFNLARMQRLLAALGNPHRAFPSAHVAGTKGKGSTCAMLGAMLKGCGFTVGSYSSPHILDVRERIQIGDELISQSDFTRMIAAVSKAAAKPKVGDPTYFEVLTAAAFLYFKEAGVDIAVIEVGLGGRLDSTNVIKPEVVGITSISHDHQQLLGTTLAQIAEEKAGTFKPKVPVVSAPQRPEVKETLRRVAAEVGAPLRFTGDEIEFSYRFEATRGIGRHTRLCLTTPVSRFEHLHVPLLGEHQAINCGLALGMLDTLKQRGFKIDDQQAMDGLASVRIPGRMEIIREHPRVLVDVAHNAASVDALMRAIGQNVLSDSMVVIFGCRRDKDIPGMIRAIQLGADKIIFTRTQSPRSADPADLAAEYTEQSGRNAQVTQSLDDAMHIALSAAGREDLICIAGSFVLVAEAKRKYTQKPEAVESST
ncbi:MAG: bifunctional folylpolyglutamate synthase/dihydrofolate synthase [Planctomycetota bacterium]|nr:MAG: bifunctional folylpolyglutamate synthase/dihydrofolate synthase [Planctomycetota bacterium]KAB2947665.1 MAG: bifunctional folylpolyglutamate synthase/dihydrofolate synthase [Phycisphaerae bacterium]MCQ3920070.1 bifunctional folylpolyglutamate synthase/dihydrofolate synthase [Planctomycetota bacterium]